MNLNAQTIQLIRHQFQNSGSEEQMSAVVTAIVSLMQSSTKLNRDNQELALLHIAKAMSGSDDEARTVLIGALKLTTSN